VPPGFTKLTVPLGLLAIENGVFFAGVAIVPSLPVIAELAAAVDVPVITVVVGC